MSQKTKTATRPELEDEDSSPQTPVHYTPAVQYAWNRNEITSDCANLLMRIVAIARNRDDECCRLGNTRLAWISQMVSIRTIKYRVGWLVTTGWVSAEVGGGDFGTERRLYPAFDRIDATPPNFPYKQPKQRARSCTTPPEDVVQEVAPPHLNGEQTIDDAGQNIVQEVAPPRARSCTTLVQEVARPSCKKLHDVVQDPAHKEEKNKKARETSQTEEYENKAEKVRVGNADLRGGDFDFVSETDQDPECEDTASWKFCADPDWIKEPKTTTPPSTNTAPIVNKNHITNTPPPSNAFAKPKTVSDFEPNQKPDPTAALSFETRPQTKKPATTKIVDTSLPDDDVDDFFQLSPEEQAKYTAIGKARFGISSEPIKPEPLWNLAWREEEAEAEAYRLAHPEEFEDEAEESIAKPKRKNKNKAIPPHLEINPDVEPTADKSDEEEWATEGPPLRRKQDPEQKRSDRQAKITASLRAKDGK